MKSKYFLSIGLIIVLAFASGGSISTFSSTAHRIVNIPAFTVSLFYQGNWRVIGSLAFEENPSEKSLDLSQFHLGGGWAFLRLQHAGNTAAHIDAALIDGRAPRRLYGAAEAASLALRKLSQKDFDLIDATSRTLYLVYEIPAGSLTTFSLTARIEPEILSQTPYQFPLTNLYQEMSSDSAFYTYAWDSQPGSLTLDGDLQGENLGQPFLKEFITPGSGHPSGIIYFWVSNDAQNLYVALDFVSDNTMDGDKDYAKVYLKTPAGLKVFKVSVPEQVWGKPGFVYTPRAVYQHKVYEFSIPKSELGQEALFTGAPLSLAFAAYGTVIPPDPGNYPGPLDPTFSGDGWTTTNFGSVEDGRAVFIQPNGKIVVAGYSNADFAVARYNQNGSLDTGFDGDGRLTTDFAGGSDSGYAVAPSEDGRIVVAGISDNNLAVARYEYDGNLDLGFSGDGKQTTDLGGVDRAYGVAVQNNGKVVVSGSSGTEAIVARYNFDGTRDLGFGAGGVVATDFGGSTDCAYAVALQTDGKIVAVGTGAADIAVARYNSDGTLDNSFDGDGLVITDFGSTDSAQDVAIQEDGKIVVAGYTGYEFAVARYNDDGSLDASFSGDGMLTTDFDSHDSAYGVVVDYASRIVVAGYSGYYLAVARYTPNGLLDPTFGTGGKANTFYGGGPEGFQAYGYGVALQAGHKIVICGWRNNDFIVVRYDPPEIYLPLVMNAP